MVNADITYNQKSDKYTIKTNLSSVGLKGVVESFLHLQVGAGEDDSKPNVREEYNISISADLRDDSFNASDDCGNECLREGILLCLLRKLKDDNEDVTIVNPSQVTEE